MGAALLEIIRDWRTHLFAKGLSPRTVSSYSETLAQITDWLKDDEDVTELSARRIEQYLAYLRERSQLTYTYKRVSPATVAKAYRNLRQFYKWLEEEGIVDRSPMHKMHPPKVDQKQVPIIPEDQLQAVLRVLQTRDWLSIRDRAIILLLLDTGMRVSELVGIRLDDIDWNLQTILITGKGRKQRTVAFSSKPAEALRRYLRNRKNHPKAALPALWITEKGALTGHGVRDILTRRSKQAGIPRLNPHRFRHQFAHEWLAAGGTEVDLMRIAGWSSRQMVERYGASAATERAITAHRRLRQ